VRRWVLKVVKSPRTDSGMLCLVERNDILYVAIVRTSYMVMRVLDHLHEHLPEVAS